MKNDLELGTWSSDMLHAAAEERRSQLEQTLQGFFIQYYRMHGRHFPWREGGTSSFGILVAEILLRQTRAEMVASVWPIFVARYSSPLACSLASEDELREMLSPLGLGHQRSQALRSLSAALVDQHKGVVPHSIEELVALPHIGVYAAHATACFAYCHRVPIVDGNVLRVFGRLTGEVFPSDNRRAVTAWDLARRILPKRGSAKEHNYGLLDFAAQVCASRTPRNPACGLKSICSYCQ